MGGRMGITAIFGAGVSFFLKNMHRFDSDSDFKFVFAVNLVFVFVIGESGLLRDNLKTCSWRSSWNCTLSGWFPGF